jgi:hypothetical protein
MAAEGLYNDGRTARAHPVRVFAEGETLVFRAPEGEQRWPLAAVSVEVLEDHVRLAPLGGRARLSLGRADWSELTALAVDHHAALRRRHGLLVGGLAAAAAVIAGAVFVGIPAASGPLARATPPRFERQIGDNFEAQLSAPFPACKGAAGQAALRSFGRRLQDASATPFEIRVHAVHAPMVNAWAMPGGAIMVTDLLIDVAKTPDELSAVIAHEAAHVQKRHVMQSVWRAFGFGVLLDAVVGGGTGAGQQLVLYLGSFSNLRFSREAEAEADRVGQDLLSGQGLSSEGMAPFFQRLATSSEGKEALAVKELVSNHPDTLRRAAESRARARPGAAAFSPDEWRAIKASCNDGQDPLRKLRKLNPFN